MVARRAPANPSAAHRRMADAMAVPPPRAAVPAVPTVQPRWTGHLTRHPVTHDLTGLYREDYVLGHRLILVGHAPALDRIALLATVEDLGCLLPVKEDHGLSDTLFELRGGMLRMELVRDAEGVWHGAITGTGWRIAMRGTQDGPGRLALVGECVHAE